MNMLISMRRTGSFFEARGYAGCKKRSGGFTLIELLVILFSFVLILLLVPSLAWQHRRAAAKHCENNLKQVGLAFKTWSLDGGDSYTMAVSTNSGGTMELIDSGQVFMHFLALSNELTTSRVLVCPRDP